MANEDVAPTEAELLDEIAELLKPQEPPKGGFTAQDMAARWKMSVRVARTRLENQVGVTLEKHHVENRVYYTIKDKEDG